jgi:DNA-directed RNA polymerase specialized sigma24 family protein
MSERAVAAATSRGPLDALLLRLRDEGGANAYEALRRRLIQFFRLHVPAEADDLADVVLDRLARKIADGVDVASVPGYALGIARMVLHEARARGARRLAAEADPTLTADADGDAADAAVAHEAMLAALGACLDAAGERSRELILRYYGDEGAARIATRKALADAAGVSLNALRNRALRLREALEDCVRSRLGRTGA